MRFIPGIHVWFNIQKSINVIHKSIHPYQWMQKKHLIKSICQNSAPIHEKTVSKLEMGELTQIDEELLQKTYNEHHT